MNANGQNLERRTLVAVWRMVLKALGGFACRCLFRSPTTATKVRRSGYLLFLIVLAFHAAAKPNVLFIAADDLRVELGCYGGTIVKSPNIDKLAARGTLFTRAYCQQAVCNPSRASVMTGLRPSTLGIWLLRTHFRERVPDVVTLPQHFKDNGYFTQNIGKVFHNWRQDTYKGDALSWSVPAVMHYGTHGSDTANVVGELPPEIMKTPRTECRDVPDEAYFDGRIANLATQALRDFSKKKEPFFLAVGFWKPHLPFNPPKKYWDLYDRANIRLPANPNHPEGAPPIALHDSREALRGFKDRPGGKPTHADTLTLRHGYYAATTYMDTQIGKVLDELERLKLADNTIIVFWSDHGFHLGEQGLWAKTSNYELDARVPLIIVAPGQKAGQKSDALVELLDMYPTLNELCGLSQPEHLEGKSLVHLLEQPCGSHKEAAFTWHPRPAYPAPGEPVEAMGYAMKTGRYRYVEWRDFKTGEVRETELYDHQTDPDENRNVFSSAKKETLRELADQLAKAHPRKPVTFPKP